MTMIVHGFPSNISALRVSEINLNLWAALKITYLLLDYSSNGHGNSQKNPDVWNTLPNWGAVRPAKVISITISAY